jgi:predicted alpha/beta superfamily hydrolase
VEPVTPCWVVGVGYPGMEFYNLARRSADYLPAWPKGAGLSKGDGGRALAFARYLDEQLVPELEARNGRRFAEVVLHGHSYGGLFTLYKLLFCPGRTDAFFAISPSLWWAQGWVMSHLHLASQTATGKTVFLGIGREERGHATDSPERSSFARSSGLWPG